MTSKKLSDDLNLKGFKTNSKLNELHTAIFYSVKDKIDNSLYEHLFSIFKLDIEHILLFNNFNNKQIALVNDVILPGK